MIFALSSNITLSYADIVARTFNVILLHVNLLRSWYVDTRSSVYVQRKHTWDNSIMAVLSRRTFLLSLLLFLLVFRYLLLGNLMVFFFLKFFYLFRTDHGVSQVDLAVVIDWVCVRGWERGWGWGKDASCKMSFGGYKRDVYFFMA